MEDNNVTFEYAIERGCGIDVHKKQITVTIGGKGIKTETREFSTFTKNLKEARKWIKSKNITHIAMESTGVYWKPLFNIFEEDFEIVLVNARHVHQIPGNKTDKKDSRWLCKLLLAGLLKGSFIPPKNIRELRDLTRYKTRLKHQRTQEKNRILKILEDANIKLGSVLTDVFGATGRIIIESMLVGESNPKILANKAKGTARNKIPQLQESVKGKISEHHKFMIRTMLNHIKDIDRTINEVMDEIGKNVKQYKTQIEHLDTIPGVNVEGAIGIISEIGTDMGKFGSSQQLASYAGVCPGNNESAGKKKSSRINKGNLNLKELLVQLAWAAVSTKDTYFFAKFKSLVGRIGKKRALIAIGHKIIIASFYILRDGVDFRELGPFFLDNIKRDSLKRYYLKRIKDLGIEIEIIAS